MPCGHFCDCSASAPVQQWYAGHVACCNLLLCLLVHLRPFATLTTPLLAIIMYPCVLPCVHRKLGLSHHSRRLFVSARCPDGCVDGYCMEAATEAGLYCSKCMNNLVRDKATGACCKCPLGQPAATSDILAVKTQNSMTWCGAT